MTQEELEKIVGHPLRTFEDFDPKSDLARLDGYSECPDCREYTYKLGKCEECGITDGYLWCQRCGEPCWNIERSQCEECNFTD